MDGGKIEASDFYECGVMAAYAGDYEGAIASFYQACAIMPCWPAARAGLCLAYHEAGRSDEMLAAFEELPTHESADAERLFVMAVALYGAGEYRAARRHARRSIRLRPGSALAHYVYGRILLASRRYAAADRALVRALELAPTFQAVLSLRSWTFSYLSSGEGVKGLRITQGVRRLHQPPFDLDGFKTVRPNTGIIFTKGMRVAGK
jgi:tetratricopeptide (TPR) repeat protein